MAIEVLNTVEPGTTTPVLEGIAKLISSLIWPIIVIACLFYYRNRIQEILKEVAGLVRRTSTVKGFGIEAEVQTQLPSADAHTPTPQALANMEETPRLVGLDGFLTEAGIRSLVQGSGANAESVRHLLKLFHTSRQRTWLVATDKTLYCILDGASTRASGRLIQWAQSLGGIEQNSIRTKSYKSRTGLIDIGNRKNWLYSLRLHPDPEELVSKVWAMISPETN